jgi:hypothetical protein
MCSTVAVAETLSTRDGTPAAIVPIVIVAVLFFGPTLYISLDTSLYWTSAFHLSGKDAIELKNTALFVLTLIWPAL